MGYALEFVLYDQITFQETARVTAIGPIPLEGRTLHLLGKPRLVGKFEYRLMDIPDGKKELVTVIHVQG